MPNELIIDSVTLTGAAADLHWSDEFAEGSDLVGHVNRVAVDGTLIVQAGAQQAGRLMTLVGGRDNAGSLWGVLTRAQVEALRAIAAVPGRVFNVTLTDGRTFTAMFRRDGPAVEAEAYKVLNPAPETRWYIPILRLVLV